MVKKPWRRWAIIGAAPLVGMARTAVPAATDPIETAAPANVVQAADRPVPGVPAGRQPGPPGESRLPAISGRGPAPELLPELGSRPPGDGGAELISELGPTPELVPELGPAPELLPELGPRPPGGGSAELVPEMGPTPELIPELGPPPDPDEDDGDRRA